MFYEVIVFLKNMIIFTVIALAGIVNIYAENSSGNLYYKNKTLDSIYGNGLHSEWTSTGYTTFNK